MGHPEPAPSPRDWVESDDWLPRARRLGPLRYSDLGPRRLTPPDSADVAGLASWIATAVDHWWSASGRPDPYTLAVVSADEGHLARAVMGGDLRCGPALRYVMVHPGHDGRGGPPAGLARLVELEDPAHLYPVAGGETADEDLDPFERPAARGIGPMATFLTEVPVLGERAGAIVAVDALSRQPYELYEQRDGSWCEVRVAARDDQLVELTVPAGLAPQSGPPPSGPPPSGSPPSGPPPSGSGGSSRWRRLTGAADWLRRQLPTAEAGVLAVVDVWAGPGDTESVDLGQLRQVREPLDSEPRPVAGTGRSAVTWRLG